MVLFLLSMVDDQQMVPDQPQAEAEKSPPQKEKIGRITILIQHVYETLLIKFFFYIVYVEFKI